MTRLEPANPPPPQTPRILRSNKEARLRQQARVIWLYGLSGAGKSTIAIALERQLAVSGFTTMLLDGDEVRAGLNRGLGFSDSDRAENLRRVAEVAKLFAMGGIVTICAFITPRRAHREMIRDIVGANDFLEIHLNASFATCASRDPKGLYAQAAAHNLPQFTGVDSIFEATLPGSAALVVDTESAPLEQSLARIHEFVLPRIAPAHAVV